MENLNQNIENHYLKEELYEEILNRLNDQGIDLNKVKRSDIAGVDEFHVRVRLYQRNLLKVLTYKEQQFWMSVVVLEVHVECLLMSIIVKSQD